MVSFALSLGEESSACYNLELFGNIVKNTFSLSSDIYLDKSNGKAAFTVTPRKNEFLFISNDRRRLICELTNFGNDHLSAAI